jgi:hypothetical protein
MSVVAGLVVATIGVALAGAGLAAWTGSWNFWATPGVPGYGVLPLLLLPAGIMCASAGIVASLGDLAENGLVAVALLPVLVGFFGGALVTIPGFFLLMFWSPKHLPDPIRPRWLPPTWTPPENSFSTISRPFVRRELRDLRPSEPHWPAVLVESTAGTAGSAIAPPRYGFLGLGDATFTWYDCTWDTPECEESFTVSGSQAIEATVSRRPSYKLLQAPVVVEVIVPSSRLRFEVFTGFGPGTKTTAIDAAMK